MQYISINLYRKMINHALAEGLEERDFDELPIPPAAMEELRAVPAENFFALHEWLDQKLGPGFSVRVGREMKIEDYGVLGLSWRTCSTAGEIFERCERYFHLLSNTYVFKVEREADLSHVYLYREAYRRGVALSNEATFAATLVVLQATTETKMAPLRVGFQHDPPRDLSSYQEVFNCPVFFQQAQNSITYTTANLNTRTAKADLQINKFLLERVEEEKRGIEVSSIKIASDVERLIQEALPSGIPSISQIGERIGMSSRTLSRRLTDNGITFRALVKSTQEKTAKALLQKSGQTISEIAFQTGFSEQSAFSRAFKRWTGQSPLEYRNL